MRLTFTYWAISRLNALLGALRIRVEARPRAAEIPFGSRENVATRQEELSEMSASSFNRSRRLIAESKVIAKSILSAGAISLALITLRSARSIFFRELPVVRMYRP